MVEVQQSIDLQSEIGHIDGKSKPMYLLLFAVTPLCRL